MNKKHLSSLECIEKLLHFVLNAITFAPVLHFAVIIITFPASIIIFAAIVTFCGVTQ